MKEYRALYPLIEPAFLDRGAFSLCIILQLLAMYLVGTLAASVLPRLSPRVKTLPQRRRKQLYVAFPVIMIKAVVILLISDILLSTSQSQVTYPKEPPMDYRFHVLYVIAISYIFEILQRPSTVELVLHHIYLQGLPFYYYFYLRHRSLVQANLTLKFFELMVLLGPGATDISSDVTFLLYYCAPRSRRGFLIAQFMSWVATGFRMLQWTVLIGYGYARFDDAKTLLQSWEKTVFWVSVLFWVLTEVDEVVKIRGMVGKFWQSLIGKQD